MKAFVARNGVARLEDREVPVAGPNDVVVRTTLASICTADPVSEADSLGNHEGYVLGHEAVGVVHAVGFDVHGFHPGQRVVSASTTPCGQCQNCQRGFSGHCGGELFGGYSPGVTRDGVLAEYFVVPDAELNLALIPDDVSDLGALFVADTFSTGSSGIEAATLPLGGVVVVSGQGHVGLGVTAAARIAGAGLVITVKSRPGGEDIARAMGADVTLNHAEHDVRAEILRLTDGVGADLTVEASGASQAFPFAIEVTRLGGEVSVLATYYGKNDTDLSIPLSHWGFGVGDKKILTTFQKCGSERVGRLMRLVQQNRIDPSAMFTHEYDSTDIAVAFEDVRSAKSGLVKPVIRFS